MVLLDPILTELTQGICLHLTIDSFQASITATNYRMALNNPIIIEQEILRILKDSCLPLKDKICLKNFLIQPIGPKGECPFKTITW